MRQTMQIRMLQGVIKRVVISPVEWILQITIRIIIGIVVLFDFDGDGKLELAVFQCCSVRLSEEKWLALYYGDTGPNITALQDKNGHNNWSLYIRPGKP